MKKYALAMGMAALVIMPAIAFAAESNPWKNFSGVYEMTASGSCIHSQNGFNEAVERSVGNGALTWMSTEPIEGVVYAGTTVWLGTWIFNPDGTGTYSDTLYATVTPPPPNSIPAVAGGLRVFHDNDVAFTYTINSFGDININEVDPPKVNYTGSISPDKKRMVLVDTPKIKGPAPEPLWYLICTASRTLIKLGD